MKKVIVMFATAMLVSGTALAGGPGGTSASGQATATNTNTNTASASNLNTGQNTQTLTVEPGAVVIQQPDTTSRDLSGPQEIHYSGEYKLKNTPAASAPALTTTMTETCMGSTSAGGSLPGFGLSFGTTWRDGACVRRLDARELNSLGYRLGAKELMCDSDNVRAALKRAGTPCYDDLPVEAKRPEDRAVVAPVVAPAEESPALGYQGIDILNMSY